MRWDRQLKYRNTASVVPIHWYIIPMYSIAIYNAVAGKNRAMTSTKLTSLSAVGAYEMCLQCNAHWNYWGAGRHSRTVCTPKWTVHSHERFVQFQTSVLAPRAAQSVGYDCIRHERYHGAWGRYIGFCSRRGGLITFPPATSPLTHSLTHSLTVVVATPSKIRCQFSLSPGTRNNSLLGGDWSVKLRILLGFSWLWCQPSSRASWTERSRNLKIDRYISGENNKYKYRTGMDGGSKLGKFIWIVSKNFSRHNKHLCIFPIK